MVPALAPHPPCLARATQVNPECSRAIQEVTLNGKQTTAPTFQTFGTPQAYALWKLPGINLTPQNASGSVICITLRANGLGTCPTMDSLCTGTGSPIPGVW